jgi:hypothetical protein
MKLVPGLVTALALYSCRSNQPPTPKATSSEPPDASYVQLHDAMAALQPTDGAGMDAEATPSSTAAGKPENPRTNYAGHAFACGAGTCTSGESLCCHVSECPSEAHCAPVDWAKSLYGPEADCYPNLAVSSVCPKGAARTECPNCEVGLVHMDACGDSSDCAKGAICCSVYVSWPIERNVCVTDTRECTYSEVCRTSCRGGHSRCESGKCKSTRAPHGLSKGFECLKGEDCADGQVCVVSHFPDDHTYCAYKAYGGTTPTHTCVSQRDCVDLSLAAPVCADAQLGPYKVKACISS